MKSFFIPIMFGPLSGMGRLFLNEDINSESLMGISAQFSTQATMPKTKP